MSTTTRILFIGNSYTNRNDLPGLLTQLAASGGKDIVTDRIIANGMALKAHWNKAETLEVVRRESWDYVVLQEQSTLPFKSPARMRDSVLLFDEAIREQGAKTVLYLTWARQDALERQREITEAYQSIGKEVGAIVVPAGLAWESALREHPEIVLHDPDQSHPALAGSFLAACVFYATLFEDNPLDKRIDGLKMNDEEIRSLQKVAWETVQAVKSAS